MKQCLLSIVAIALLIFSTNACSQMNRVSGSENYITKDVKIDDFDGIRLSGSPNVIYTQSSGKAKVQVYGADNIVALLETVVEDGTLIIKFKNNTQIQNHGKLEVSVSSPNLERVKIQGSGDITLANGIKNANNMDITIQGSGNVRGNNIECKQVSISIQGSGNVGLTDITSELTKANIAGSGNIQLIGTSDEAEYSIGGSGNINALELLVANVNVRIGGSGSIKCHATELLKANIGGSGSVTYKGNPQVEGPRKGLRKI